MTKVDEENEDVKSDENDGNWQSFGSNENNLS